MSDDLADDLHDAEDQLTSIIASGRRLLYLLNGYTQLNASTIAAAAELSLLVKYDYCRVSCDHEDQDEDEFADDCCGCPCHGDDDGRTFGVVPNHPLAGPG